MGETFETILDRVVEEKVILLRSEQGTFTYFTVSGAFWYMNDSMGSNSCSSADEKKQDEVLRFYSDLAVAKIYTALDGYWEYDFDSVKYLKYDIYSILSDPIGEPIIELAAFNYQRSFNGLPFLGDSSYTTIFMDKRAQLQGFRVNWRKTIEETAQVSIIRLPTLWEKINQITDEMQNYGNVMEMSIRCGYLEPSVGQASVSIEPVCRLYFLSEESGLGIVPFSDIVRLVKGNEP